MIISLIDNEKGELLKEVLGLRVPCKWWIKYYLAKNKNKCDTKTLN